MRWKSNHEEWKVGFAIVPLLLDNGEWIWFERFRYRHYKTMMRGVYGVEFQPHD